MAIWHEEDHPRDDEGKFTYKNGGVSSSTLGILKGGVEKVRYPDNLGDGNNEGVWGDVLGGIGHILGRVFGVITNPSVISGVLGVLAAKYTISELKTFKEMLSEISEAKSNAADKTGYATTTEAAIRQDYENERKMKKRADILYGNDYEYYNKYHPERIAANNYETNTDYKPIHDTYRNILIDANTYAGKADIEGYKPYYTEANRSTGFYGRAYINEETKTVVIAYKGADEHSYIKDWWNNGAKSLMNNVIPEQFKDAEKLYYDVINKLGNSAKDYKIDFAGYSLGGNLAQLMGAKYGNETVTFNAFGAGFMENAVINYTDNITNYGHLNDIFYNLPNTSHIGKNIYTKDIGGKEGIMGTFYRHELEHLGDLRFKIKKRQ